MVTTQVKVMRSCHKNPVATDKTNLKKPIRLPSFNAACGCWLDSLCLAGAKRFEPRCYYWNQPLSSLFTRRLAATKRLGPWFVPTVS